MYWSGMWLGADLRIDIKKYICSIEIGLRAQSMLTILGSIANMIGRTYMTTYMRMRIITLILNKIFIWTPKIMRQMVMAWLGFVNHLALFAGFINLREVGAKWQN
jgi:hypothetical protein